MLTMSIVQDSNETGRLHFNANALRATGRIGASIIDISPYFSPERKKVEEFIRQVYAKNYQADIEINYPILMSVRIAEIGNLASLGNGASIYLFAALSSYLKARKINYATITGTKTIQERLRKLGLEPRALCNAVPALLSDEERKRWGSYYEQNPQVLCGSVEEGVRHLQNALGIMYEEQPDQPLFPRLHFKGTV